MAFAQHHFDCPLKSGPTMTEEGLLVFTEEIALQIQASENDVTLHTAKPSFSTISPREYHFVKG